MIYAYCLSLFSVHFFSKHNIANFKLRLINQQTADCTDSIILHTDKLTSQTFPVPIKLKGGEHLLVKVKLLSLPSPLVQVLIGEGVVSFDKDSIDNTLRVPIYDKQKGVEEVAICSIDFFLSGFEVDKHVSINADKSRSRFDDLRDRTQDAVYSQMSYTLESERESARSSKGLQSIRPIAPNAFSASKIKAETGNNLKGQKVDKNILEQQRQNEKLQTHSKKEGQLQQIHKDNHEQQQLLNVKKVPNQSTFQPFTLENNVYLQQKKSQKKGLLRSKDRDIASMKGTKRIPSSRLKKKFMFDSEEEPPSLNKPGKDDFFPENLKQTVKENEEVLSRLKKYISFIEKEESPKQKRRRKKIKVEEFAAYSAQNNFVKYHVDHKSFTCKNLKNMKAIRIVQNQIKQSNEEKIFPQAINRVTISSLKGLDLLTFDANGFRSHCLSNGQSESVVSIMIPTHQNAIKVTIQLQDEGQFQGVIGLQEGEQMAVNLARGKNERDSSLLEKSAFKLLFDIKSADSKVPSIKAADNIHHNQMSFRQQNSVLAPGQDIKVRVGQLSCQPWGFVKSYAQGAMISAKSKELMSKMEQQLPRLKQQVFQGRISNKKKTDIEINTEITMNIHKNAPKPSSASKEYLDGPIKKSKPLPTPLRREADSINSIRNGNRNNYRFKDRSSKDLKEAWQEILFRRNLQAERRKMETEKQIRKSLRGNRLILKQKEELHKSLLNESNTESENDSVASPISKKTNKIYQFVEQDKKKPLHPIRTFTLKILNFSITQPQSIIDQTKELPVGKFVKFSIKNKVIYFTEVIFNGRYNSILWKLQGCVFSQLTGIEKLKVQIFETLNNRVTTLGVSYIRVNRLYFLRNNHIYNGTIMEDHTLFGEFTLGFEIEETCPFEVIHQQDEETLNFASHQAETKRLRTLSHQSQKQMLRQSRNIHYASNKNGWQNVNEDSMEARVEIEQSMSMPVGLNQR